MISWSIFQKFIEEIFQETINKGLTKRPLKICLVTLYKVEKLYIFEAEKISTNPPVVGLTGPFAGSLRPVTAGFFGGILVLSGKFYCVKKEYKNIYVRG